MFDQTISMPMRAAIASLLGSLFGIMMILSSNPAQAQSSDDAAPALATVAAQPMTAIKRLGEAALRSLRGAEPSFSAGTPGARGLRFNEGGSDSGAGLRWQAMPSRVLRSEVESPRGHELFSLGVQVRF